MPARRPTPLRTAALAALALWGLPGAAAPAALALPQGHALENKSILTDELGMTHTRLAHRYQGLRIWGSEAILHSDRSGRSLAPTVSLALPGNLSGMPDLKPALSVDQARDAVRRQSGAQGGATGFGEAELLLVPRVTRRILGGAQGRPVNAADVVQEVVGYDLAWRIPVETGAGIHWEFLVDAAGGKVLDRIPLEKDATLTGRTNYHGAQELQARAEGDRLLLADPTRGTGPDGGSSVRDMTERWSLALPGPIIGTGSNDPRLGDGLPQSLFSRPGSSNYDTVAADVAYSLAWTWDYFKNVHQRTGMDGKGTEVHAVVHFTGSSGREYDNAQWNGQLIAIKEPRDYWSLSDIPFVAHEWAHGLTDATAGLVYKGEAGGLNEATSDIFANMVKAYAGGGDPKASKVPADGAYWDLYVYLSGLLARQTGEIQKLLRSMVRPSRTGALNAWGADLAEQDPHYASGPMNRAFYYLSQGAPSDQTDDAFSSYLPGGMTGIGNDKAARIWYRALTVYLTATSDYLAARNAALSAAEDLYGPAGAEQLAVAKAFAAINVGAPQVDSPSVTPSLTLGPAAQVGTDLHFTATAVGVLEVHYLVDDVEVAVSTTPPSFFATLDDARTLSNGTHTFRAIGRTYSRVLNAAGPDITLDNPYQQMLKDPSLETLGAKGSPWKGHVAEVAAASGSFAPAHTLSHFALFNRASGEDSLILRQQVTVPAGSNEATLSLWAWIKADPLARTGDKLEVQVRTPQTGDQPGDILARVLTLKVEDAWADWVPRTADLRPFAGQTVDLCLVSAIAPLSDTAFAVDDVRLVCASSPVSDIFLGPATVALRPGDLQTFSANVFGPGLDGAALTVVEVGGGTLSGTTYTAPRTPGFYHVVAVRNGDPDTWTQASIQVLPPLQLVPSTAVVSQGSSRLFQVVATTTRPYVVVCNGAAASLSTLPDGSPAVLFEANKDDGDLILQLYFADDLSRPAATATVTVMESEALLMRPSSFSMATGASLDLGHWMKAGMHWSIQEGEDGTAGTLTQRSEDGPASFTAPATARTVHLVVADPDDPSVKGVLTVNVVAGLVLVHAGLTLEPGETTQIFGQLPGMTLEESMPAVDITVTGGTYTPSDGFYVAPDTPGIYTVTAVAKADPTLKATAQIVVISTDLNDNGKTGADFGDMAALADAYGTTPPAGRTLLADTNGDGTVDDEDVIRFLRRFIPGP
jgi:Zn-dependent metalloprotease